MQMHVKRCTPEGEAELWPTNLTYICFSRTAKSHQSRRNCVSSSSARRHSTCANRTDESDTSAAFELERVGKMSASNESGES